MLVSGTNVAILKFEGESLWLRDVMSSCSWLWQVVQMATLPDGCWMKRSKVGKKMLQLILYVALYFSILNDCFCCSQILLLVGSCLLLQVYCFSLCWDSDEFQNWLRFTYDSTWYTAHLNSHFLQSKPQIRSRTTNNASHGSLKTNYVMGASWS